MIKKKLILGLIVSLTVLSGCAKKAQPAATSTPGAETGSSITEPVPTFEPVVESDVVLLLPKEDTAVSGTFDIQGLAPGSWFFEGQIVGEIINEDGVVLETVPLAAIGEWMTDEHVKFEGTAEFDAPVGDETIDLLIKNDNPSGLPENEKSQKFTLRLEQ